MGDKTEIKWTDATWNPIRGCSIVSDGCKNCYAMGIAARFTGAGQPYEGLARQTSAGPRWTGEVRFVREHLLDPIRWRKPRRIFVNSMSDLFHDGVTDEQLDRIFAVMALSGRHVFQILTKRPSRMMEYLMHPLRDAKYTKIAYEMYESVGRKGDGISPYFPLPNVWLGVSTEDQKTSDERIPLLLKTPAAVRWVSAEPLLGPIDLARVRHSLRGESFEITSVLKGDDGFGLNAIRHRLDWVVAGGESGPNARPCHPDWARGLRDQCQSTGVAFFWKQWGEWVPLDQILEKEPEDFDRRTHHFSDGLNCGTTVHRIGKKAAGRLLDGRTWDEYPEGTG